MTATIAPPPDHRPARAAAARARCPPSARCSSATSPCCARTSRSSSPARSSSRCCWSSCSPTSSRRSARASAAAAAAATQFSSVLVAGVVATAILFQGIQAVALPLVQEFGYTREIEDRVLAPLPVQLVAFEKIVAGALQCLFAGLIVFPIATVVPATPVHLDVNWLILLTLIPLACIMSGALGLFFGTIFEPRTVPMLFGVILIPITFLGCTYYSWLALEPIRWLQVATLVNPLVYLSEGFRAALTPVPHMSLLAVYPVVIGFAVLFSWLGIRGFTKRVIA